MRINNYIGRIFDEEGLKTVNADYSTDGMVYEAMTVYKVIMQSYYDEAPMYSCYYLEILVDEDNCIRKIYRHLDELAFSNYPRTIFPAVFEEEAEEILNVCTALTEKMEMHS